MDRTSQAFLRIKADAERLSELASVELALHQERSQKALKKKRKMPRKKRGRKARPRCGWRDLAMSEPCQALAVRRFRNRCKAHRV